MTHSLLMHCNNRLKAARAKKLLQKRETIKEQKRVAALAAGVDWKSDDSDDESPVRKFILCGRNWIPFVRFNPLVFLTDNLVCVLI